MRLDGVCVGEAAGRPAPAVGLGHQVAPDAPLGALPRQVDAAERLVSEEEAPGALPVLDEAAAVAVQEFVLHIF